jgi:hypothetical protein
LKLRLYRETDTRGVATVRHFRHVSTHNLFPNIFLLMKNDKQRITYFNYVWKLHTWFCLSYFLEINIKLYCIYQYFMSINSFFNTVSVSDTAARLQWLVTQLKLRLYRETDTRGVATVRHFRHVSTHNLFPNIFLLMNLLLLWMLLPSHFKDENIF